MHEPDALIHEWMMLQETNRLDHRSFVIVWDDLEHGLELAFESIVRSAKKLNARRVTSGILRTRGWLGDNEDYHRIGILAVNTNICIGRGLSLETSEKNR